MFHFDRLTTCPACFVSLVDASRKNLIRMELKCHNGVALQMAEAFIFNHEIRPPQSLEPSLECQMDGSLYPDEIDAGGRF